MAVFRAAAIVIAGIGASAVSGTASATGAVCPTGLDLPQGIRADYSDGTWAEYVATGHDRVRITESPDPATQRGFRFISRFGLYDLAAMQGDGDAATPASEVPASRIATTYSVPEADLPRPEPGGVWSGRARLTNADGTAGDVDAHYVFNDVVTTVIGGCTYPTITVKAAFVAPDGWMAQEFVYFPTLGFAAVVAGQIEGEPQAWRVQLTKIASGAP